LLAVVLAKENYFGPNGLEWHLGELTGAGPMAPEMMGGMAGEQHVVCGPLSQIASMPGGARRVLVGVGWQAL
jgi:hypothetical protein